MQVEIKFIVGGANSVCGGFAAGDVMRCSEAMARHLVVDCGAAEYAHAKPAAEPAKPIKAAKGK